MYNIHVPLVKEINSEEQDGFIATCRRAKIDRVFLAFNLVLANETQLLTNIELLKKKIAFFKLNGIKVGIWLFPTLGYGGTNGIILGDKAKKFMHKRLLNQNTNADQKLNDNRKYLTSSFCPIDSRFVNEFCKCISEVAKTDTDIILLEDDLSLSSMDLREMMCCCPLHMKEYRKRINENLVPSELSDKIFAGGKNFYRDEWLKLKNDTMMNFMQKIRIAVDKANSSVRVGLCANRSSFELDGAPIQSMAKAVAGATKPFVRLTGAPYWEETILAANIETVRLQVQWLKQSGIEIISEGDTYPRPRLRVPANYLEYFDMILRADGGLDGIFKYMIDYNSNSSYEPGYIDRHIKNLEAYDLIDKIFGDKKTVGVNIVEKQNQISDRVFDKYETLPEYAPMAIFDTVATAAQLMMKDNSIPTAYGSDGYANIVFGENARALDLATLKSGTVLDFKAAKILSDRGVDVGMDGYTIMPKPNSEYFADENDSVMIEMPNTNYAGNYYKIKTSSTAIIKSMFKYISKSFTLSEKSDESADCFPACYLYQNKLGQRFAVYSFIAASVQVRKIAPWTTGLFRNYYRQQQLISCIEWTQNKKLPAVCVKNPNLYILCKKNESGMAVGLWNLFEDSIYNAEIKLDNNYGSVDFYYGQGSLTSGKITLKTEIPPFGFMFFVVK